MTAKRTRRRAPPVEQIAIAGVEDDRARWAEHEACFTPEAVAGQIVSWMARHFTAHGRT